MIVDKSIIEFLTDLGDEEYFEEIFGFLEEAIAKGETIEITETMRTKKEESVEIAETIVIKIVETRQELDAFKEKSKGLMDLKRP